LAQCAVAHITLIIAPFMQQLHTYVAQTLHRSTNGTLKISPIFNGAYYSEQPTVTRLTTAHLRQARRAQQSKRVVSSSFKAWARKLDTPLAAPIARASKCPYRAQPTACITTTTKPVTATCATGGEPSVDRETGQSYCKSRYCHESPTQVLTKTATATNDYQRVGTLFIFKMAAQHQVWQKW
jgi:hypothetical protein